MCSVLFYKRKLFNVLFQPVQITAFDVSPDGALYAIGDGDGNVTVSSTSGHGKVLSSKPHLSTILGIRFFPSSKVILTNSNDFSLSIISADDLSVPRTLKGHSRAVTDSAIVSRGKNVLSCAKVCPLNLHLFVYQQPHRMGPSVYGKSDPHPKSASGDPKATLPYIKCHSALATATSMSTHPTAKASKQPHIPWTHGKSTHPIK